MRKYDRIINRKGQLNFRVKGIRGFKKGDVHNYFISISWPKFFLFFFLGYILINLTFTFLFFCIGLNNIGGVNHSSKFYELLDTFFFSVQILSTTGFTGAHSLNSSISFIATFESMISLLFIALTTGLLYSRFSRPTAKMIYSKYILVGPYHNKNALMVRVANYKRNQLVKVNAQVILTLNLHLEEGVSRLYYPLLLEASQIGMLILTWTIVHVIDEESPLCGMSVKDLENAEAEIIVVIEGTDDMLGQPVFSRFSYKVNDLIWNAQFNSITDTDVDGSLSIDIDKIDCYIPVD